ncbi:tail fiber domain-containing protein, partial [Candidatus Gracilibacteria bacterium]|nr:tail fiber domain-containing protein [Candidatus Gracilibacteria bacterium]
GNVGIGTTAPNVKLDVIGDIEYTGTITDVSDRRLKENFEPLENALARLDGLQGYTFNMLDDPERRQAGVIAQDVQEVLPEAVSIIDDAGHLGVDYTQLIPLLIEAVKEQQGTIVELDAKYQAEIAILNQKIELLQSEK